MSDLAAPAAAPAEAGSQGTETQGRPAETQGRRAEATPESRPGAAENRDGYPRRKRRGGLPDDLSLTAKPKPKEPQPKEAREPERRLAEPKPREPEPELDADEEEDGAGLDRDQRGRDAERDAPVDDPERDRAPPEIPDDHVFQIETDPDRGPEPWTFEELKSAAALTEEAVKWKGLGEQAVEHRNRLVNDLRQNPMETLMTIGAAILGDTPNAKAKARAWLVRHATALVNENIRYEELPEEQRMIMEKDRQIEDLKRRLQAQDEADQEATQAREQQELFQRTHNEISQALGALGYEAEDEVVQEVASVLDQAHLAGHTHITASTAAKMVIQELEERAEKQWENFDPAKAPREVLEAFRKFEVQQASQPKPTSAPRDEPRESHRSKRRAGLAL